MRSATDRWQAERTRFVPGFGHRFHKPEDPRAPRLLALVDEAAALEAKERAEQLLSDKQADIDYARAQAELAESMAQLAAIRKLREKSRQ